jgi:DNA-binding LacI/PurR family transcriptional regulator
MSGAMVTLKDIAREAGVSVMTVSNVVNGNFSKVSKEKAEQILKIIEERKYVPNSSARSLAKSNSRIIALILRGEQNENTLQSAHNATLVGTIIQKVQNLGYYIMINIFKSQEDISQSLRTWNVEGAILLGMFDDEIENIYRVNDIPMVFIDSYSKVRQLSNVGIDDYKGGQLAAQYLIDHGHRKMAFVGPPTTHNGVIQHRFSGFCDALKKNGLSLKPENQFVLESDVQPEVIIETGREIASLGKQITAAFVTSDQIASYLIHGLKTSGMRVPENLSIIGFDDLMIGTQMTPQLTTIAQDLDKKARLSVEILFRQLQSPGSPAESMVLDVELKERESVATIKTGK